MIDLAICVFDNILMKEYLCVDICWMAHLLGLMEKMDMHQLLNIYGSG